MTYIINCVLANIAWNKLTAKVTAFADLFHSSCNNSLFFMTANVLHFITNCGRGKSTLLFLFSFTAFMITAIKKGERKGETSAKRQQHEAK